MFEVSSPCTHTSSKSSAPLINSHVDSRLFKAATDFNQPLLQFGVNKCDKCNSNCRSIGLKRTPLCDCMKTINYSIAYYLKRVYVILPVVAVYKVVHL